MKKRAVMTSIKNNRDVTHPRNLLVPADDGDPSLVVVHVVPDGLVVRKHEPDRVASPLQRPVRSLFKFNQKRFPRYTHDFRPGLFT